MILYYIDISLSYTKTVDCKGKKHIIESPPLGRLPPKTVNSLLLKTHCEKGGETLAEVAIDEMARTLYDLKIVDGISMKQGNSLRGANRYDLSIAIYDPLPTESVKLNEQYGGRDKLYRIHFYSVCVRCGEMSKFKLNDEKKGQAISTFEYWNNRECDWSVLYQPPNRLLTITDLGDCFINEVIVLWKEYCLSPLDKDTADTTESASIEPPGDLEALRDSLPSVPCVC